MSLANLTAVQAFEVVPEDIEAVLSQHTPAKPGAQHPRNLAEAIDKALTSDERAQIAHAAVDGGDDLESQSESAKLEITKLLVAQGYILAA